jgi:hypothetical protein
MQTTGSESIETNNAAAMVAGAGNWNRKICTMAAGARHSDDLSY